MNASFSVTLTVRKPVPESVMAQPELFIGAVAGIFERNGRDSMHSIKGRFERSQGFFCERSKTSSAERGVSSIRTPERLPLKGK